MLSAEGSPAWLAHEVDQVADWATVNAYAGQPSWRLLSREQGEDDETLLAFWGRLERTGVISPGHTDTTMFLTLFYAEQLLRHRAGQPVEPLTGVS